MKITIQELRGETLVMLPLVFYGLPAAACGGRIHRDGYTGALVRWNAKTGTLVAKFPAIGRAPNRIATCLRVFHVTSTAVTLPPDGSFIHVNADELIVYREPGDVRMGITRVHEPEVAHA